ncbi:hypothetical protein S7711_10135, partial [Stachybotrys chartarum IBT 7711]
LLGTAIRRAAKDHALPESTLRCRLQGRISRQEAKAKTQRLSQIQEESLVNWILAEERAGRAPTKNQMLGFAEAIAREGGGHEPLGHNWIPRFIQRNKGVKLKGSQALENQRALSTTEDLIRAHIARLETIYKEKNITPSNMYNADETGVTEGESHAGKVLRTSLTKDSIVVEGDCREWVTILECGNAIGSPLKVAFHEATRHFASFEITAAMQKQLFIEAYKQARHTALTSHNLRAGFRAAGIWPILKSNGTLSVTLWGFSTVKPEASCSSGHHLCAQLEIFKKHDAGEPTTTTTTNLREPHGLSSPSPLAPPANGYDHLSLAGKDAARTLAIKSDADSHIHPDPRVET